MSYLTDEEKLAGVYITEKVDRKTGWQFVCLEEEWTRGYLQEIQDFMECVALGRQPLAGLELAFETIKINYAGYWSAEEGTARDALGACPSSRKFRNRRRIRIFSLACVSTAPMEVSTPNGRLRRIIFSSRSAKMQLNGQAPRGVLINAQIGCPLFGGKRHTSARGISARGPRCNARAHTQQERSL